MSEVPAIGVLAVQGSFALHGDMLRRLGAEVVEVRKAPHFDGLDGLILPGGESSTMLKFLDEESLAEPIRRMGESGCALYGTCAGAILLARTVDNPPQDSLGLLDITVLRNGYGRQVDSHIAGVTCSAIGGPDLPVVMIRGPVITGTGPGVKVLATHRGHAALVRQGRVLASTFHPELTEDTRVHEYFLQLAAGNDRPPKASRCPDRESGPAGSRVLRAVAHRVSRT